MENKHGIEKIAVIGAGVMGHGIAQEFAIAGFDVRLTARSELSLHRAVANIKANTARLLAMGKIDSRQVQLATDNVTTTTSIPDAVDNVDMVMEYVAEDLSVKKHIFAQLDKFSPDRTILITGTSSLMPSDIAVATNRPDKVLAAHYANPPYLLPFVEIIGAKECSETSIQTTVNLLRGMGKQPVVLKKEIPGFAAMRLQGALLREALWLVEKGVLNPSDVDTIIKTGIGRRWSVAGVFEVFDLAGWDLIESIGQWLFPHLENSSKIPSILQRKIQDKTLGVKTGEGFYKWSSDSEETLRKRIANALVEIDNWPSDNVGSNQNHE